MPQPDENANANAWLRSKSKVKVDVGGSTFKVDARDQRAALVDVSDGAPQATPEQAAAAGGADGGAHGPEPKRSFNDQIRDAFWGSGSLRGKLE
jgi:hypothetical protein